MASRVASSKWQSGGQGFVDKVVGKCKICGGEKGLPSEGGRYLLCLFPSFSGFFFPSFLFVFLSSCLLPSSLHGIGDPCLISIATHHFHDKNSNKVQLILNETPPGGTRPGRLQ